jgi:hypothetical protein
MSSNNTTDLFANLTQFDCDTPHTVLSWNEFFFCYNRSVTRSTVRAVLELLLVVSAILFNLVVIAMIYYNSITWTVFDQILVGHCILQALTAAVDIPFFHIDHMFGYWPLPKFTSYMWASYDNSINTTTNLTMLFMCWARLRSIVEPCKFKDEFLIKHPKVVMAFTWVIGLTIWIPITLAYDMLDYSVSLNYDPILLRNVFNFVFWFLPLLLIVVFSVKIIWILNKRSLRKMHLSNKVNDVGISAVRQSAETRRTGPLRKASAHRPARRPEGCAS